MSHNKAKKNYIHPGTLIYEPTTELQAKILDFICRKSSPDYKSLMKATGRSRITIRQSLRPLIRIHLIDEEMQDPLHRKSKRIFYPTDRGIFYTISKQFSIMNEIDKVHSLPTIIQVCKEFVKIRAGWRSRSEEDWMRIFVEAMYRSDLFDDNGKCIVKDETDLWKFFIRTMVMEQLQDKYFDIENIFSQGGTWMNLAQSVGPIGGGAMFNILKKIRDDLDEFMVELSS